jgi:hypothetical protein
MPRLTSSGSNWPHGRGAGPGNLGPSAIHPGIGQVLAEIRSRPHFSSYNFRMTLDDAPTEPLAPTHRWQLFEQLCGEKVRISDAAWVLGLLPAERLAVADDLFVTVRAARVAAGDWQQVDARAWQETLSDRIQQVRAFRRYDEALRGTSPLADAR